MSKRSKPSTNGGGGRADVLPDEDYFMAVAFLAAQRSKDPSTQVGACIVNQDKKVIGIGHNCMPTGCEGQLPWKRDAEDKLDNKYLYVCHAELNAVMNKHSADVRGCTIYVALFPCNECTKVIIQAGIKKVVYYSDKYHDTAETTASRRMLELSDVQFEQFRPTRAQVVVDFEAINQ